MYNGIGLQTARGSGTNGYVQRNLSYIRPQQARHTVSRNTGKLENREGFEGLDLKKANEEILEHARKRQIELKLFELRDSLQERGLDSKEIDARVKKLRSELSRADMTPQYTHGKKSKRTESHLVAAEKMKENERIRRALGIRNEESAELGDWDSQERNVRHASDVKDSGSTEFDTSSRPSRRRSRSPLGRERSRDQRSDRRSNREHARHSRRSSRDRKSRSSSRESRRNRSERKRSRKSDSRRKSRSRSPSES